ncbi:MAG: hypothetical protein JWM68_2159 [Verrucomicrobiales bacterium]|nr:hypothetical protein [Verrucomicrobiales bacterium]
MSLINDALKRAQAQQKQPASDGAKPHLAAAPPMQTAEQRRPASIPVLIPVLIIVILLIAGGVVTWQLLSKTSAPVAANVVPIPKPVVPSVPAPIVVAPKPLPVAEAPKIPAPVPETKVAVPVVAPPAQPQPAVVVAAPVIPAVPTFPAIKLQGIFFSKSNPTAMLNGKTLPVGGKVDGAIITKIESVSVTLEWNGETKTLELQ